MFIRSMNRSSVSTTSIIWSSARPPSCLFKFLLGRRTTVRCSCLRYTLDHQKPDHTLMPYQHNGDKTHTLRFNPTMFNMFKLPRCLKSYECLYCFKHLASKSRRERDMKYDCKMLPNVFMECGLRFMSIMQLLHPVLSEYFKCTYTLIECAGCQQSECNDLRFECPQCDVCCESGTDMIDHVLMKHSNMVTCHMAEDGGLCCFANDDEESCHRPARWFLQKFR